MTLEQARQKTTALAKLLRVQAQNVGVTKRDRRIAQAKEVQATALELVLNELGHALHRAETAGGFKSSEPGFEGYDPYDL
jgi:hypothetical protein